MDTIYINFFSSKEEAFCVEESPIVTRNTSTRKGIKLLPDHPYEYVQKTSNPNGVVLEDWTVKVMSLCGEELGDISDKFLVKEPFDDFSGTPQIVWSVKQIGQDFGQRLIYLEITQTEGETWYTNPFEINNFESEKVTRFDYRDSITLPMLSIGLTTYFRNPRRADVINQRYEKSTGKVRTLRVESAKIYRMFTEIWSVDLIDKFLNMLGSRYLYRNLVRHYFYEVVESPDPEGTSNFSAIEYLLTPYEGEDYDPNYVPPTPLPPIPGGSVTVKVRMFKVSRSVNTYRPRVSFEAPDGFTTVLFNFSSASVNGNTTSFNPSFSSVGQSMALNTFEAAEATPNQGALNSFVVRINDGTSSLNVSYTGPDLIFTNSEITNGIEKTIEATITTV